jgi:hypothetical protein
VSPGLARVIERRIAKSISSDESLDDLIDAAPDATVAWMRRKAALADGTGIDLPVCDTHDVIEWIDRQREQEREWTVNLSRVASNGWRLLLTGLLRDLCACSWSEIGKFAGTSEQGAIRAYRLHARAVSESEYGTRLDSAVFALKSPKTPARAPERRSGSSTRS